MIGQKPGTLAPPPPLPPLPGSPEEAVRIALASNPDLIAISQQARAAGLDVNVARATRLPTVSMRSAAAATPIIWEPRRTSSAPSPLVARLRPALACRRAIRNLPRRPSRCPYPAGAGDSNRQILEQVVGTERSVVANTRARVCELQAATRGDPVEPDCGRGERARAGRRPRRAERSAPVPSSTSSTPSRNCSTRRSCW